MPSIAPDCLSLHCQTRVRVRKDSRGGELEINGSSFDTSIIKKRPAPSPHSSVCHSVSFPPLFQLWFCKLSPLCVSLAISWCCFVMAYIPRSPVTSLTLDVDVSVSCQVLLMCIHPISQHNLVSYLHIKRELDPKVIFFEPALQFDMRGDDISLSFKSHECVHHVLET